MSDYSEESEIDEIVEEVKPVRRSKGGEGSKKKRVPSELEDNAVEGKVQKRSKPGEFSRKRKMVDSEDMDSELEDSAVEVIKPQRRSKLGDFSRKRKMVDSEVDMDSKSKRTSGKKNKRSKTSESTSEKIATKPVLNLSDVLDPEDAVEIGEESISDFSSYVGNLVNLIKPKSFVYQKEQVTKTQLVNFVLSILTWERNGWDFDDKVSTDEKIPWDEFETLVQEPTLQLSYFQFKVLFSNLATMIVHGEDYISGLRFQEFLSLRSKGLQFQPKFGETESKIFLKSLVIVQMMSGQGTKFPFNRTNSIGPKNLNEMSKLFNANREGTHKNVEVKVGVSKVPNKCGQGNPSIAVISGADVKEFPSMFQINFFPKAAAGPM